MTNNQPSNIVLFPASLLPLAKRWRAISRSLPDQTYLLVLPPKPGPTWDILFGVAGDLEHRGLNVEVTGIASQLSTPL